MVIIIATKNRSKYSSVSQLLISLANQVDIKIELKQVEKNILAPEESGNSSTENCNIKVNYYSKFIKDPFIVIDDDIVITGLDNTMQSHQFHGLGSQKDKASKEIFQYLQTSLQQKSKCEFRVERRFGCVNGKKVTFAKNTYKGYLLPLENRIYEEIIKQDKIIDNPLNYYMNASNKTNIMSNHDRSLNQAYTDSTRRKLTMFIKSIKGN